MGTIVRIDDKNRRSTALSVNQVPVLVPHGKDFPLADSYVEVIRNSSSITGVTYGAEVPEAECAGADPALARVSEADASRGQRDPASDTEKLAPQVPGADALDHVAPNEPPGTALRGEDPPINQVPGGDNQTHAGAKSLDEHIADEGARDEADEAESLRGAAAARDGTIASKAAIAEDGSKAQGEAPAETGSGKPLEEPAKEDAAAGEADADKGEKPAGSLNVEPFDVEGILAQSIPKITEDLDEFTDAEVAQLLKGELARGEDKRSTLIDALEARRTALATPLEPKAEKTAPAPKPPKSAPAKAPARRKAPAKKAKPAKK